MADFSNQGKGQQFNRTPFNSSYAFILAALIILCHCSDIQSQDLRQSNVVKSQAASKTLMQGGDEFLDEIDSQLQVKPSISNNENEDSFYHESVHVNGQIRNETAYRMRSPREVSKIRNEIILSEKIDLFSNIKLKSQQRFFYDSVFDVNDYFSSNVAGNMRELSELRELTLDIPLRRLDIRIGKQQIVWGEAVGTFVADTINARDYREFLLQDLNRIRIPEWAINTTYALEDATLQLVWLPSPKMNRTPVQGSEFQFNLPEIDFVPTGYQSSGNSDSSFREGEFGARVETIVAGVEFSTFAFRGWNKSPLLRAGRGGDGMVLEEYYERRTSVGGTFSKAFDYFVLKGELLYTPNSRQQESHIADGVGVREVDLLEQVVGVDILLGNQWRLNLQLLQKAILGSDVDLLYQDKMLQNLFSLWVSRKFYDDLIEPELFVVSDTESVNLMIRPKLKVYPNGYTQLGFGTDIFVGDEDLIFGQFQGSSRIYLDVTVFF